MARPATPEIKRTGGTSTSGRTAIYPWDEWSDGQWWTVRQGTAAEMELPEDDPNHADFACKIESFRVSLSWAASRRNMSSRSRKIDECTLVFQFYKSEEEEAGATDQGSGLEVQTAGGTAAA